MSAESRGSIGRVAFLTPEFPTEKRGGGGVGNYVWKMASALIERGIEAEVFVLSPDEGVIDVDGIRVERVPRSRSLPVRLLAAALRFVVGRRGDVLMDLLNARRLARAFERRQQVRPFDLVQSSNYQLTGTFVRRSRAYRRLIRISTSRVLYDRAQGVRNAGLSGLIERLDVRALRAADVAYAPSRFLAAYFNERYGTDVRVIRPPAALGATPAERSPVTLPERFLVHFGSLGIRKGTEAVAEALSLAWRRDPDLRMVWIGPLDAATKERYRRSWGARASQVALLGPLDMADLYGVVARSVASVLPSTVDNLPNTVIESLALGVPVIGSAGASIDELVEDGVSGRLVPIGDVDGLAEAMSEAWRGRASWTGPGFRPPAILDEMAPDAAVRHFLELGEGNEPGRRRGHEPVLT